MGSLSFQEKGLLSCLRGLGWVHEGFLAQGGQGQGPKHSMGYSSTGEHLAVQPLVTSGSWWAGEGWQGWLRSLLPCTLVKHTGWVASHTQVNGPIGFVCWSV